jgi:MATE family multidrug resistance protein
MVATFTFQGAQFGDVTLAANQVLMQFMTFTAFGMDGFAFAAETLVARAVGRRDVSRLRRAAWLSGLWGAALCVVMAVFFAIGGGWIIDLLSTAEPVREEARIFLIYAVLTPICGFMPWFLDGIFIGATRGKDMRNSMLVTFALYWACLYLLLPVFGNHGLWIAWLISLLVRAVTLLWRYPSIERDLRG